MADVKKEVKEAYTDMNKDQKFEKSRKERDLKFLASKPISPEWAESVMEEATPRGYNGFQPELITKIAANFKGEPKVLLGRESSVVVYFIGNGDVGGRRYADEHSVMTGEEFIERVESRQERARDPDSYLDRAQKLSSKVRREMRQAPEVHRFWWD